MLIDLAFECHEMSTDKPFDVEQWLRRRQKQQQQQQQILCVCILRCDKPKICRNYKTHEIQFRCSQSNNAALFCILGPSITLSLYLDYIHYLYCNIRHQKPHSGVGSQNFVDTTRCSTLLPST